MIQPRNEGSQETESSENLSINKRIISIPQPVSSLPIPCSICKKHHIENPRVNLHCTLNDFRACMSAQTEGYGSPTLNVCILRLMKIMS